MRMLLLQTDNLINGFAERSNAILQDNLVGVYLHGSSVRGCFNPQKSDIELIVVIDRPLSRPDGYILRMTGVDKDLEAHFTIINRRGKCLCGTPIEEVSAAMPNMYQGR